jgi:serine/threonine protein kinase
MAERDLQQSSAKKLAELLAIAINETVAASPPTRAQQPVQPSSRPSVRMLGEYELLEQLGVGGMGTVYRARHVTLDRFVAIKVLKSGCFGAEEAAARFRREIRLAGQLDDPHVVRAYDARTIEGTQFLVMEYVAGWDAHKLVERVGPLAVADACEVIRQAADGLQSAHAIGLVHRDIKPSNLMLSRGGQVKILDLGLARLADATSASQAVTVAGVVMGTPDYIAPEQVMDSHRVDIRADIYSLGCTLYHLLAGYPPFATSSHPTFMDRITAHVSEPVPPIRQVRPEIPNELSAVLDRMLAKDPAHRYSTPLEVSSALSRFTSGAGLRNLCQNLAGTQEANLPPLPTTCTASPRVYASGFQRWVAAILGVLMLIIAVRIGIGIGTRLFQKSSSASASNATGSEASNVQGVPVSSRGTDRIVVSWTVPGLGKPDLWVLSPDGRTRVNITREPRYFHLHPDFSPDGRRIAYIRCEDPLAPNAIWLCDADGGNSRELVASQGKSGRLASPVWVSDALIYYVRDPVLDRAPDMEVWQVDPAESKPKLAFRLLDAFGEGNGMITDASPDGRSLAVAVQAAAEAATADVFVCDLDGRNVRVVWRDSVDEYKDARPLWSRDPRRIAWHHFFARGSTSNRLRCGVGLATLGEDGVWSGKLQPQEDAIVPLAWSPQGTELLCARMHDPTQRISEATLICLDEQFHETRTLFDLEAGFWQAGSRDLGRIADWAVVPADLAARLDAK